MGYMLGLVMVPEKTKLTFHECVTDILRPYSELTEVDPYPVPLSVDMILNFIREKTDPSLVHDEMRVTDKERADAMSAEDLQAECEDRCSITLSEFVTHFGDNYLGQKLYTSGGDVMTDITTNPNAKFHAWSPKLTVVPFGSRAWADQFPSYLEAWEILKNPEAYKQPEYDTAKWRSGELDVKADVWTAGLVTHYKETGRTDDEIEEMGFDPNHTEPSYLKSLIVDYAFPGVLVDVEGQYHSRFYEDSVGNWLQGAHTTEQWNTFVMKCLSERLESVVIPVQLLV